MADLVPYLTLRHGEESLRFLQDGLGFELVYGPEETEWGTKRARFRDLDGHEWSVGSYRPGQSWG